MLFHVLAGRHHEVGQLIGDDNDVRQVTRNLTPFIIRLGSNAIVQLIIDPDSAVAARLSATGETGLVRGQRDRPLTVDLISPNANVVSDEPVETSGYQIPGGKALYPPGITIGFVSHIFTRANSLTKTIEIRPAVDFNALEFVLVLVRS